jgi:uncharacterized protein (DUF2384 family)
LWIKSSIQALNVETPISVLDTFNGISEVKNIIGRVAHGVYY